MRKLSGLILIPLLVVTLASTNVTFAMGNHILRQPEDLYSLAAQMVDTVILDPNKPFAGQFAGSNTVYVVQDAFNLRGQLVRIPGGCVLSFTGGTIRNGVLVGKGTAIECEDASAILSGVKLDGSWNVEYGCPEWFGAKGNGVTDDRMAVQTAIVVCKTVILSKNYLIYNAPFDYKKYKTIPDDELKYYLDVLAQKNRTPDSALTPIVIPSDKNVVITGVVKAYSPLGNLFEVRGENSVITGGGSIQGCGLVSTVNSYSGKPAYAVTNWEAALIYIKGSNNRIENLIIKDPTRQGISIDDYLSSGNVICNNIIGGGLKKHTEDVGTCSFTGLFGILARGTNTVVKDNVFKKLDGKCIYDALYCNYTTTNVPSIEKRTEVHTTFENNVVEDAFEHCVYSYASNLRITGNTLHSDYTALQLFNGHQFVDNNVIQGNQDALGIYVSGEHQVVTNNKLYNVGRYAIRCGGYYNGSCDYDYVAGNYIEKVMAPFSDAQPKTTPAITFESTAFRDNKLQLNRITCENNTIVCKGEAQSARTIPIVGIIAVYGDANTTIDQINIVNNTVLNSHVADNIGITLMNPMKSGVVLVEGNKCINEGPIISTTPTEPILKVQGVKKLIARGNHLEQKSTTGTTFELTNVDEAEIKDNALIANWNSKAVFFFADKETALTIDGSNKINGQAAEQTITIPAGTTAPTTVNLSLPQNRWDLEITPINRAAKQAEARNPLKILKSDTNSVQLYHQTATTKPTEYRVRVIYK